MKIVGDLDYGQTSDPIEYTGNPKYVALIFTAKAGDKVEAAVSGSGRKALVSIADGTLNELASGTGRVVFQIPDHGPDAEAYYILIRDPDGKPARFTVELKTRRVG